jgi:hypothetical protein
MQEALNQIICTYGMEAVHDALQKKMKTEYAFLKKLYGEKSVVSEKPLVVAEKPVVPEKPVVLEEKSSNIIAIEETVGGEVKEKKFRDPKEMKEWQRSEEEKKRLENESKGLKKETLLTKENLKKWIEDENRTYSYISRTYVGCKDIEVSAAAKLYGIVATRKNVMVHTKK